MVPSEMSAAHGVLSDKLRDKVAEILNIRHFTEVQRRAIPEIIAGNNVLIISPTGTGKTEAALLPVMEALLKSEPRGIRALYITPLRALNRDIFRRMVKLSEELGLRIEVRHGDTRQSVRRRQALRPPDLLITTPETLQAILPGRVMREHLRNVGYVIVDEVHEIIDEKRGIQLLLSLERLRELTGFDFQRIGLSATIGRPDLVARYLQGSSTRTMRIIEVQMARRYEVIVDYPLPSSHDEELASKLRLPKEVVARLREVDDEIRRHRAMLVFTNTRETAELLASRIKILNPKARILVHHGSLSRDERIRAEEGLKKGKLKALICTSSLELGIDIGSVECVVQYSSPRRATTLLQRIGRAGHRISGIAKGKIIAINTDEILEAAVLSKMAIKGELEVPRIHDGALDVLAHQIAGLVLDKGRIGLEEAFRIIRRSVPYRGLNVELFLKVIQFMSEEGIIRLRDEEIRKGRNIWRYYYENISTIPDITSYEVVDITSNRSIGALDEEFIASYGEEGRDFILGGHVWRILSIDHDANKVFVEPSFKIEAAIPAWIGELIPVPFRCAVEVGALRRRVANALLRGTDPRKILDKYPITDRGKEAVVKEIATALAEGYPIPSDKSLVIEQIKDIVVVHVPLGSKGCYTLGLALSHMLSEALSSSVAFRSDPYRIALRASLRISPGDVIKALSNLCEVDIRGKLREAIVRTELFRWRAFHVAKRFGLLSRESKITVLSRRFMEALKGTVVYLEALREIETDKLDVDAVKWLLNGIKKGSISIMTLRSEEGKCTPFALPILQHYFRDIIPSTKPLESIIEAVKNRLLGEEVRLVCLYCLKWNERRTIRYLPEEVRCAKCGSKFIAVLKPDDEEGRRVIGKIKSGQRLTKMDREALRRLQDTAVLVLNYGKRALIALAARGVGPKTAIKVLRETMDLSERDFYLKLLEAERQYIRTRRFWA